KGINYCQPDIFLYFLYVFHLFVFLIPVIFNKPNDNQPNFNFLSEPDTRFEEIEVVGFPWFFAGTSIKKSPGGFLSSSGILWPIMCFIMYFPVNGFFTTLYE